MFSKFKKFTLSAVAFVAGFGALSQSAQAQQFYLGEIIIGGWNFCPRGTTAASGALLSINSNQALFSLYGTIYGGDGRTTFALPDLRGRIPMQNGSGPGLSTVRLGERGGRETFVDTISTRANHNHIITNTATAALNVGNGGAGTYEAGDHITSTASIFAHQGAPSQPLDGGSVNVAVNSTALNNGSNLAVNIRNPYLGIQFCVVQFGIFPSRS